MRWFILCLATILAMPAQAADMTDITIAVSSVSFVLGGVRIAEQSGLFTKNHLHPHIVVMDSGNAAMSALIGQSAQFTVAGPPEVLAARVHHQDIVIVTNLYRGLAGAVVLSKDVAAATNTSPEAPVTARLKALDGLSIAVPSATSSLLGPVRTAAEAAGAHIKFVYMSQPAMVAAVESHAVQGLDASYPYAGTPIIKGTGILWINGPAGELGDAAPASSSCLTTTATYAAAHPDLIAALRQSIQDTATFIRDHPEESRQSLAKSYPQLTPPEIDLAFTQQWRNWTTPDLTPTDLRHESDLLQASTNMPGLSTLDPASALLP